MKQSEPFHARFARDFGGPFDGAVPPTLPGLGRGLILVPEILRVMNQQVSAARELDNIRVTAFLLLDVGRVNQAFLPETDPVKNDAVQRMRRALQRLDHQLVA